MPTSPGQRLVILAMLLLPCLGLCQQIANRRSSSHGTLYYSEPFDIDRHTLPVNFSGVDALQVFHSLLLHEASYKKSDFETTSDFSIRLRQFEQSSLIRGMRPKDLYAFTIRPIVSYDADQKQFTIRLNDLPVDLESEPVECTWSVATSTGSSYIGTNGFGVERSIRRLSETDTDIVTDQPSWFVRQYVHKVGDENQVGFWSTVEPARASRIAHTLRVLVIGSLFPPFATEELIPGNPTVENPVNKSFTYHRIHLALRAVWL